MEGLAVFSACAVSSSNSCQFRNLGSSGFPANIIQDWIGAADAAAITILVCKSRKDGITGHNAFPY
jgi:hypothetical protein